MATSPEKRIEAGLITKISALNYITTNSISVRAADDMTAVKASAWVRVYCANAQRLEPNYNYYRASVEISNVTHIPNDENDTVGENLYDTVNNYVQTLTAAKLTSAVNSAEITVDGIVPTQNADDYEENLRSTIVAFDCYYTYVNGS